MRYDNGVTHRQPVLSLERTRSRVGNVQLVGSIGCSPEAVVVDVG